MAEGQEENVSQVPRVPNDARRYCAKCGEVFMANRFACPYCGALRRDPPLLDARSLTAVLTDLPRARDEANLDDRAFLALRQTYERWLLAARPSRRPAVAAQPAPIPAQPAAPPPSPDSRPGPAEAPSIPPAPPAPPRPSPWSEWLRQGRQRLAAEVALHGLLYFGVLLTFIGSLGFALFAFGSVNVSLRPVAELLTPGLLFCASWFLRRQRLRLAAGSLELLAGALALVALFTSLNDGAPIPPDLSGAALAAGWAASSIFLLSVYGLVVQHRPTSALRFLVAPLFWVALWSLGMLANTGHFSVWQYPLAAAGIAITLAIANHYPDHELARATQRAALVGLPLTYGLVLLFALREGWPAWPLALTGLAVLVGSELLDRSLRSSQHFPLVQTLLVAATLPALTPGWGPERVGLLATVVSIGLLELSEWGIRGRSSVASDYLALIVGAAGLLFTFPQSPPAAAAWGVASMWLHTRTFWFRRTLPGGEQWQPLLSAALPAVFGYHLWMSLNHELAWLAMSSILVAAALLAWWRPMPARTLFYGWYLPLAAGAVLIGTVTIQSPAGLAASIELPLAAALVAAVFGLSARWPLLRLWGAVIAAAWAVQLTLNATGAGPDLRTLAWAAIGAGLAGAAWQWRARPLSAHLLIAGYLAGGLGLVAALAGLDRFAVLSLWLLIGLVAVLANETGRVSLAWLAPSWAWLARTLAYAPLIALLTSIPFWVIQLGDLLSLLAQRGRTGVALSLTGLCYGFAARRLSARRPLAPIVAVAAVAVAIVGISVAAPALVPSTLAVALAIAIVAVLGGSLRRPYMSWLAWSLSAALLMLLAHLTGVATSALPRVLVGWACVCLLGGLAYDDLRSGRRMAGEGLRQVWLLKPVAIGAVALPAALAFTFSEPPSVFGWRALVAATAYLFVAWQLRAGSISVAAWALASLAATVLLPWDAWQQPALWLPQAAALLLLGFVLGLRRGEARWWLRWDVAPLVAAHLLALVALTRSTSVGSMAVTWAGFGVLSLALAAWKRHWLWAAAGAPLILIGSNQAGPGWFALSLTLTAAASILLAWRTTGLPRLSAQWASAGFAGWAWWEMLLWTGWSQSRQLDASLLALAAVALCLATLVRSRRAEPSWLIGWAVLELGGLGTCLLFVFGQRPPWTLVIAFLAFALASATLAPVIKSRLRELSLVFLFLAGEAAASSAGLAPLPHLSWAVVAGLVALVIAAASRRTAILRAWLDALLVYAGLQSLAAVVLAASLWPDRTGLIATIGIFGVEAAVLGLILRRTGVLALSPPLLCTSWLLFATRATGGGDVQWITVPIGLAVLAVVEIARLPRQVETNEPVPKEILLLMEYAGIALVCGAALVEALTVGVIYAFVAALWGILISAWAVLTRVRRRLQAGVGVASLGLILVIAVPLARLVPHITGVGLWASLAGLGALFLVVAATLEQSRASVGAAFRRLGELTEVWE